MTIEMVLRSPSLCIPVQFTSFSVLKGEGGGTVVTIEGVAQPTFPADSFVDDAIAQKVVDGAPESLDTIGKLATALGNDPNFIAALLGKIVEKADAEQTETALAGKVDKVTLAGLVYGTNTRGEQVGIPWAHSTTSDTLARRGPRGTLQVGMAEEDRHAVPLAQMNEALTGKAGVEVEGKVNSLEKKVENLLVGQAPDMFFDDDATAYVKEIPDDVAPYAALKSVGGMIHAHEIKSQNLFNGSLVSGDWRLSASDNGVIRYEGKDTVETDKTLGEICPDLKAGETYTISFSSEGYAPSDGYDVSGSLQLSFGKSWENQMYEFMSPHTITITQEMIDAPVWFHHNGYAGEFGPEDVLLDILVMLNEGSAAIPYEPYGNKRYLTEAKVTALEIRNPSGETTHTFAIPEAVQAIDGYGWGIPNGAHNGIEWDDDGKPVFVKRVGKAVYNGTESWARGKYETYVKFELGVSDMKSNSTISSNKFAHGNPLYTPLPCAAATPWSITYYPSNPPDTLEGWKAQLAEWYAKGDPLTVYYELKEPIITDISAYFTQDNLIPVEGGGVIVAQNENEEAAPTTIRYQVTGATLADAFDQIYEYAMQKIGGTT